MPKVNKENLRSLCPDVDERLIEEHCSRLDAQYFERFSESAICRHLRGLAALSGEHPASVLLEFAPGEQVEVTVLAFDYPGVFSLITGVLAGMGFSILSGAVHTYAPAAAEAGPGRLAAGRRPRRPVRQDFWRRRRIVDHFQGAMGPDINRDAWAAELRQQLQTVIGLLESGADAAAAKRLVNESVARRLERLSVASPPALYPLEVHLDNADGRFTRVRVVSEDTPAFLFALSNALALKGISIERVNISTTHNRIEDELDIVDAKGSPILDPDALDQIRLSVVLTKQFTHFLGKAPDPFAALARFEHLVEDILQAPERGLWLEMFSDPMHLQQLAQLLGASDFLWEDVIRLQYETLLPILKPHAGDRSFAEPVGTLAQRLEAAVSGAGTLEEQRRRLNEFKDREIFLIDLDHILNPGTDFRELAEHLTALAESVVRAANRMAYAHLAARFGIPVTVAGLEARFAIVGLGKFGGAALGYASDIEMLLVYSDNGETRGPERIGNREFFEQLVRETAALILAKREGIFHMDLRLRPYGVDGPLAASLESFCDYYGPQGQALAYERLSLVRLRAVGGDPDLGAQIERLRDEFVYAGGRLNVPELREVREKQLAEKTRPGGINAKFSPGGLVDLEYDVQILQVIHGRERKELRTPRIHQALAALRAAGVLDAGEGERLVAAYEFLRRLINGLRMLRGSAKDLFLPPLGSGEYLHLARRLGYESQPGLTPEQQLHLEFEMHTAAVRVFVEHHFGRESLPGPATGTVADVILSDQLSEALRRRILAQAGFQDPDRAYVNLRSLAGGEERKRYMVRLAILACDLLARKPDPDRALNNWERFVASLPGGPTVAGRHFETLLSQPMRLEILLSIFAASQFLADTLIRNPEFFDWVTNPENLGGPRRPEELAQELVHWAGPELEEAAWLGALRRFRRREILRIGTRDICLHAPLEEVTRDLSTLAEVLIQAALDRAWGKGRKLGKTALPDPEQYFCILAFGKLGGQELNYSSDIDLLGVAADEAGIAPGQAADGFTWIMETVSSFLSRYTEEGYVYRVDLRLRPFGLEGLLVPSLTSVAGYYRTQADLMEIQALLKLRPVAGTLAVGELLLAQLRPVLLQRRAKAEIVRTEEKMRNAALQQLAVRDDDATDVKSGLGGLRDIEFMVQGLQLQHAPQNADLLDGNTLRALEKLARAGFIPAELQAQLTEHYIFLRRVEHYLQILEDRQIHVLPAQAGELNALAKRVMGIDADGERFQEKLQKCLQAVRAAYLSWLGD